MVRYELIDKKLIVSPTARQVYRVSAIVGIGLLFGLVALELYGVPQILAPVLRPLLFFGALGEAAVLVGMEVFLFRYDNSHPLVQIFWFCLLLVPFLGAAFYCFVVYSRSDAVRASVKSEENMLA